MSQGLKRIGWLPTARTPQLYQQSERLLVWIDGLVGLHEVMIDVQTSLLSDVLDTREPLVILPSIETPVLCAALGAYQEGAKPFWSYATSGLERDTLIAKWQVPSLPLEQNTLARLDADVFAARCYHQLSQALEVIDPSSIYAKAYAPCVRLMAALCDCERLEVQPGLPDADRAYAHIAHTRLRSWYIDMWKLFTGAYYDPSTFE